MSHDVERTNTSFSRNNLLITLCILFATVVGDRLVERSSFANSSLVFKCIVDSGTHFSIAALAWLIVRDISIKFSTPCMLSAILCGLIASIIDADHFIAAQSLNIKEATSLQTRPLIHCITISLITFMVLCSFSFHKQSIRMWNSSWILLTAVTTHLWRDGYRRGLWFCPLGSTPPYPYWMYLLGLSFLPIGLLLIKKQARPLVHLYPSVNIEHV